MSFGSVCLRMDEVLEEHFLKFCLIYFIVFISRRYYLIWKVFKSFFILLWMGCKGLWCLIYGREEEEEENEEGIAEEDRVNKSISYPMIKFDPILLRRRLKEVNRRYRITHYDEEDDEEY